MSVREPHIEITLVHSEACHFCDDALGALELMAHDHPVDVRVVAIDSPEGAALVAQHRPPMNPLVLVDGRYFSAGRLPRKKLLRHLMSHAASATTTVR